MAGTGTSSSMEVLQMRWQSPGGAVFDLGAGLLGSILVLNLDSMQDKRALAFNAGTVLAARMLTELLEYFIGMDFQPVPEILVASGIWWYLHYSFNPSYSKDYIKRLYPGTVIAFLALSRALGKCA